MNWEYESSWICVGIDDPRGRQGGQMSAIGDHYGFVREIKSCPLGL